MPRTQYTGRCKAIFEKYYTPGTRVYDTVSTHSRLVADKALSIARNLNLDIDLDFLAEAALLHDIGVVRCYAPELGCHGNLNYIRHGVAGRALLEAEGLSELAMVCEHHTGAGLTVDDIRAQRLPLPRREMLPLTLVERLVCYADKFYSKSGDITREKPIGMVLMQMEQHGEDTLRRFIALHEEFSQ